MSDIEKANDIKADRLFRLRNLHLKMNGARKLNNQERIASRNYCLQTGRPNNQGSNTKKSRRNSRRNWRHRGEDYNIVKMRNWTAEEVEHWERKKKKNPDTGFADFEQASYRQYQRLTKQMKPNLKEYTGEKEKLGEEVFYAGTNTLGTTDHKDTPEAISRMVEDLDKQIAKRAKYSSRRVHDEDIT
ncbi:hypothetical protein HELRODRAFT_178248 [Helobdella robusta]|uniref:Pre-mRNA-splicing factor SYF2 n=1 Tax=Helobdella robusta TaxID=6412 RepID=T1FCZ7_HELRO|nr:hypothetical protein HELRODRAFT_178248 [Helobdella robusta]ESN97446.1 hypothetical protein HELRODRAFT_178248 [Helobdella robusta]